MAKLKASTRPKMGRFIVVHGIPNVGKSSFAASAERPYYLYDPAERGILRLMDAGEVSLDPKYVVKCDSWDDTLNRLDNVPANRQTIVLDAGTGFQQLAYRHVADSDFDGKMSADGEGFFAYQKGPKRVAHNEWPRDLISRIVDLTNEGKDVIFLAHSHVKLMKNPSGEDYEKYIPYLDQDVWMQTVKDAQYVLFMGRQVEKGRGKNKADVDSYEARIFISPSPTYESKSLPLIKTPSIPMGDSGPEAYANFLKAIGAN